MKLDINELERKWNAATPASVLTVIRYSHGGGRAYTKDERGENRELVADFYDEANREFYLSAISDWPAIIAALREGERLREEVTHLNESHADDLIEVASVLQLLDDLSQVWGDEGVFRRCRDRLRVLITPPPKE